MDGETKTVQLRPPVWALGVITVGVLALVVYLGVLSRNALKAYDYIGRTELQIYTITVSGEGKVTAKPDIAEVSLGLQTENPSVANAQKENTEKMNKIVAALKSLGIEDKDIQTTNYSIYPIYDYPDGQQKLRGYQVAQNVTLKIRNLDKVGDVLAKAGDLGANQIGGLNFTIDEPEVLRQQAREKALLNAKEKAEALAKISGAKLGKLVSFSEGSAGEPIPYYRSFGLEAGVGGAADLKAPEIQPGSQDIVITASVTYEIL